MKVHLKSIEVSKPKQQRSRKTMEKILDTAQQMLVASTFEKSSIQEIVNKASSSVGSFYSLFKTKSNLLECLLDRYQDWLNQIAQELKAQNHPIDIVVRTKILIQEYIRINKQESGMLRARHIYNITNLRSIPESRLKKNEQFIHELEQFFEPCLSEINHTNPRSALTFILKVIDVYIENSIIHGEMVNDDKSSEKYKELEEECVCLFLSYLNVNYEKE